MSNWYYTLLRDPEELQDDTKRCFEYNNMHQWDIIKALSIYSGYNGLDNIVVCIECSGPSSKALTKLIEQWLETYGSGIKLILNPHLIKSKYVIARYGYPWHGYYLIFNTPSMLTKFLELQHYINRQYEKSVFTPDIMHECANVVAYYNTNQDNNKLTYNYTLPLLDLKINYAIVNSLEHSCERKSVNVADTLVEFLWGNIKKRHLSDDQFEQFQYLLTQGEDVNRLHPLYQIPPLAMALAFDKDKRVLEHLIYYHGDPTSRATGTLFSALDYALALGDTEIINILMLPFTNVERPITLMVKNIGISFSQNYVRTDVDFYHVNDPHRNVVKSLSSELKKKIDPEETSAIYRISKQAFAMRDDPDLRRITKEIERNLAIPYQIFEIIRDSKRNIIGYSLYELITTADKDKLYWHCNIAYIAPDYRQTGIMTALIMGPAYALRELFPGKTIGIYYLAIHPNSYRLADNYLHWPMYQPPHMEKEIKLLLEASHLIKGTCYHHDGISCFVDNQIVVRESRPTRHNFRNEFFFQNVLRQSGTDFSGYKSTPVLFYACAASDKRFREHARQRGINCESYLAMLTGGLRVFLSNWNPRLSRLTDSAHFYLQDSKSLFWYNTSVPSNEALHSTKNIIYSKV